MTTDYLGGYQYQNTVLQFFPTAEGYVKNTPVSGTNTYSYVFNYTDHLGNTRLSYTKDTTTGSLKILEENNYYPFGLKHNSYNVDNFQPGYKYKYNGKELQDELGLNQYDYGARNYDPALGRWMNIDPKAELLEISSPYVYALNSPIVYLDKDGELPIFINGRVSSEDERGKAKYWSVQILNTIRSSGIANPHTSETNEFHFVDGDRGWNNYNGKSWASKENPYFASDRAMGGRIQASEDWNTILSKLKRDPKTGKIIEKIQIYTHSRGAAFGQGYTEQLFQLIKENANQFQDANGEIEFSLNLDPHQSYDVNAVSGVPTYSIDHDNIAAGNGMNGVKAAFTTNETVGGFLGSHKNASFVKDLGTFLKSFQTGSSTQKVIDKFVKTMKNQYYINVTVK